MMGFACVQVWYRCGSFCWSSWQQPCQTVLASISHLHLSCCLNFCVKSPRYQVRRLWLTLLPIILLWIRKKTHKALAWYVVSSSSIGPGFAIFSVIQLLLPVMSLWLQRSHGDHSYWDIAAANFKHAIGLSCELVVEHIHSFIHSGQTNKLVIIVHNITSCLLQCTLTADLHSPATLLGTPVQLLGNTIC